MDRLSLWTMRAVGTLNIAYCTMGITVYLYIVHEHVRDWPGSPRAPEWTVFTILSVITLFLTVYLAYLGLGLIRRHVPALLPTLIVFVSEIAYFVFHVEILWVVVPKVAPRWYSPDLIGGFLTYPLMVLAPQLITFYPVLGILAVWYVILRVRRNQRMVDYGAEHADMA